MVKGQNFQPCHSDHTLFTQVNKERKFTILIVYVDIIVTGNDLEGIKRTKRLLSQQFEIEDLR